jgi:hypothetical protein
MKQNVMKKWVKALRSGKFKQGQGTLKQFNKQGQTQHCCLGVLCELYNNTMKKNKKKTLPEKVCDNDRDFSYGYSRFGGKKEDLPKDVMKWAGIGNSMGEFTTDDPVYDQYNLADLNDTGRKFKTIADIIEKNYEQL